MDWLEELAAEGQKLTKQRKTADNNFLQQQSSESSEQYLSRMRMWKDKFLPVLDDFSKQVGKPLEKWSSKDVANLHNSPQFRALLQSDKSSLATANPDRMMLDE